ncbi:6-phosphofructokinase [Chloroflexota bacterium]
MKIEKRLGILTGGGDCPGLNAAIRATAKSAFKIGYEVIGLRDGWEGLLYNKIEVLDGVKTSNIIDRGGTILGASRTSPFHIENGPQQVLEKFEALGLRAVVVLGGEGTLNVSSQLFDMGLPVVGIPKTIDNDVKKTDYTIGFQTAVQIATDALDRLRSTAASHHRVMLLEVMGRYTGWIATYAGTACGADAILIPEIPVDEQSLEELYQMLVVRNKKGMKFSIVVVSEGIKLQGKAIFKSHYSKDKADSRNVLGGVGQVLGELINNNTDLSTRVSSLGYIQRGGTPVAYDRSLATAFGVKAVELVEENKYGEMAALKGNRITSVPLKEVASGIKAVNLNTFRIAKMFFN